MWNSYDWGSEFEIAYLTLLLKGRSQSQKLTWNWLQIVWVYQGNNIIKFGWEGISLKKLCHFLSCTVSFFRQYIYLVQLESVNFNISIKLRIAKQGSNLKYISVGGTSPENDWSPRHHQTHYSGVIMDTMASQITSPPLFNQPFIQAQVKENIKAPLAFVRGIYHWPGNSPHKGPVTREIFPFDDIIMILY